MLGPWTYKGDPGCRKRLREIGIFRQETVTRMNGFRASLAASGKDCVHRQIALGGACRPDANALIGVKNGPGEAIRVRIYGDRFYV